MNRPELPSCWVPKPDWFRVVAAEARAVHEELMLFRDDFLPALVAYKPSPHRCPRAAWQHAITMLDRDLLHRRSVDRESFRPFLCEKTFPAFSWKYGTIHWKISLDSRLEPPSNFPSLMLSEIEERAIDLLPFEFSEPFDTILPFVSEYDPEFVRMMLDLNTWRFMVFRGMSPESYAKFIKGEFSRAVRQAILRVVIVLANNHFSLIRDYLSHSCLPNRHRVSQYLFTILFEKVYLLSRCS